MTRDTVTPPQRTRRLQQGEKLRSADKVERIPVKVIPTVDVQRKPEWMRIRLSSSPKVQTIKNILRKHKMATVCEEAACPNLHECFSNGTATFMIMGEICTRRCPFCDVGHGKPNPLDTEEPKNLALAIHEMALNYVVITSVDRDDLRDGGAQHFADCIREAKLLSPDLQVEVLVPDFRGRMAPALEILTATPPDVFNHNMETVPRLYREARPGANYEWSLKLLKDYKALNPHVPTKSGLMVGLGETKEELLRTLDDLRAHDVDMLTVGQYLQPSVNHLPVDRFVHPDEFAEYTAYAESIGFKQAACGPLVRSSYHADKQARGEDIT
ncbi:lipoic acid synthetase [marine gamma proteobacterium HTCC2207]|jgi:lipoic acid synthetase|uniref:Lipoyl synthase n=1 Tax=gamma proteobacterium HTCC2207 TaxID=314287 RepID=Q1YSR1_9GAMM|nr:lipoic acid synthetase [marine gamma proteobacterium HTCC2207] [gamma proteobacterium HTCC2207]MBT5104771.1 lipoyl synthase [Porticoccaceae bacterium]MBT6114670.1 lipoyl synthase [Porticoccaceae bacterium]MBT6593244.1 lipoyl synthase [Porticoccaceae bacterium]MDB4427798.1 lipoyl synthase [Porticoccaceae bacterium]